jgi:hypothetical protein
MEDGEMKEISGEIMDLRESMILLLAWDESISDLRNIPRGKGDYLGMRVSNNGELQIQLFQVVSNFHQPNSGLQM